MQATNSGRIPSLLKALEKRGHRVDMRRAEVLIDLPTVSRAKAYGAIAALSAFGIFKKLQAAELALIGRMYSIAALDYGSKLRGESAKQFTLYLNRTGGFYPSRRMRAGTQKYGTELYEGGEEGGEEEGGEEEGAEAARAPRKRIVRKRQASKPKPKAKPKRRTKSTLPPRDEQGRFIKR